jgi:hypothetical protein
MVSVIEDQTPEQVAAFDAARTRAVADLRRARPQMSDLDALLALKSGCDKSLAEKARGKNAATAAAPRVSVR